MKFSKLHEKKIDEVICKVKNDTDICNSFVFINLSKK